MVLSANWSKIGQQGSTTLAIEIDVASLVISTFLVAAFIVSLSQGFSLSMGAIQSGTVFRSAVMANSVIIFFVSVNFTYAAAISGLSFRIRLQSNEISADEEVGETGNDVPHFPVFPTVESVIEREIIQPLLYDCFVISTL